LECPALAGPKTLLNPMRTQKFFYVSPDFPLTGRCMHNFLSLRRRLSEAKCVAELGRGGNVVSEIIAFVIVNLKVKLHRRDSPLD
jgi:hypothetical protein